MSWPSLLAAEKLAAWSAAPAEDEDDARTPPKFALAYFAPAWEAALQLLDAALARFA